MNSSYMKTLSRQLTIAILIIAVLFILPYLQKPDISQEIILPVNVLVIRDTEGVFASERNQANIENLFSKVNEIWLEGNISFQLKSINLVGIETSQMESTWESPGQATSLENFDGKSINVVFIRNMSFNGVSFPKISSVFVPDHTSNREQVALAHELGHVLGLEHRPDEQYLMFNVCNETKISFYEIRAARENAKKLFLLR